MRALGLIETIGLVGAIEGLDAALKAANVEALGYEFVGAGIVTVKIRGDIGAVKASIQAAEAAVERVGTLRTTHVIARTSEELELIINNEVDNSSFEDNIVDNLEDNHEIVDKVVDDIVEEVQECDLQQENDFTEVEIDVNKDEINVKETEDEKELNDVKESETYTKDELQAMKVSELRTVARTLGTKLTRKKIKFAKKDELVEAILEV